MLILQNKGFHRFMLTILPLSLFNTWIDLSYSALGFKLFICKYSVILRLCMLVNFVRVFGHSQWNCLWQSSEYSVAPDASHFLAMLSLNELNEWAHIFLFILWISTNNDNLICKCWANCLAIVLLLHNIFFRFVADVKTTLHPLF